MSKTFDNGVVCASEQAVIAVDAIYDAVRDRFRRHGGTSSTPRKREAVRAGDPGERRASTPASSASPRRRSPPWPGISVPATHPGADRRSDAMRPPPSRSPTRSFRTILALYPRRGLQGRRGHGRKPWWRWAASATPRSSTPTRTSRRSASNYFGAQHEDRAHPDQHAVLPRRHRRSLQLQPVAQPDPGLRQLGRQFRLGERGAQAPAQQEDRRQARRKHAVAQAAQLASTSAAAACPKR